MAKNTQKHRIQQAIADRLDSKFRDSRNYHFQRGTGIVKLNSKAKQQINGSHHRQIEKELLRPFVFVFVPKWENGKIVASKYQLNGRWIAAHDEKLSFWTFNPKLKAAGYKPSDFNGSWKGARSATGVFDYAKHSHLIL